MTSRFNVNVTNSNNLPVAAPSWLNINLTRCDRLESMVLCIRGLDCIFGEYNPVTNHCHLLPAFLSNLPTSITSIHLVFQCKPVYRNTEADSMAALQHQLMNMQWKAIGSAMQTMPRLEHITFMATGLENCVMWDRSYCATMAMIKEGLFSGIIPRSSAGQSSHSYANNISGKHKLFVNT